MLGPGQWLQWVDPLVQTRWNPNRLWQECESRISLEAWELQLRPETHSRQQQTHTQINWYRHTRTGKVITAHMQGLNIKGWIKTAADSWTWNIMLWYAELQYPPFLCVFLFIGAQQRCNAELQCSHDDNLLKTNQELHLDSFLNRVAVYRSFTLKENNTNFTHQSLFTGLTEYYMSAYCIWKTFCGSRGRCVKSDKWPQVMLAGIWKLQVWRWKKEVSSPDLCSPHWLKAKLAITRLTHLNLWPNCDCSNCIVDDVVTRKKNAYIFY